MSGSHYYLLTSLPAMSVLGEQPPLCGAALYAKVRDEDEPARLLVSAILLSDDLLQRDGVLSEVTDTPTPAVLTVDQLRGETPLPDALIPPTTSARKIPGDETWEAYYLHALDIASTTKSAFLTAWVQFEIALRNELVEARSRLLEIEPTDYFILPAQGECDMDLSSMITEWSNASNPLAAQRVLDQARWRWIDTHEPYFTFQDDELAAYAARLLLVERWDRLKEEN